ncbi:MAG: hypothetical protein IJ130_04510 [Solobacterium sp.]|nr:hypothetical protein [Solobacterium sp.]
MTQNIQRNFKYDAVMKKGRPVHRGDYFSLRHPAMMRGKRAKIFAPFAALKGFEEEVLSKDIVYENRRSLSPDEMLVLNDQLRTLHRLTQTRREAEKNRVLASVEYYVPCTDPHHEDCGIKGSYETVTDIVRSADPITQKVRIGDLSIAMNDIFRIRIHRD